MSEAHRQLFPALPKPVEDALRESVKRFGVLVPVVKDQHGRTIDGRHRAVIADELGVSYRVDTVVVADDAEADEIQHTLNADRRHLDADQRREVAVALRQAGHSYRAIGGALGVDHKTAMADVEAEIGENSPIERVTRTGGGTYPARRPTLVTSKNQREADRTQAALGQLDTSDLPEGEPLDTKDVTRQVRDAKRRARVDQLGDLPTPSLEGGPWPVIYADPPWRYQFAQADSRSLENQYPTMTVDEIAGLAVPAADDAVLFLWATSPLLLEALSVMDAWGFTYRTCMVWVKDRIGMGYYARQRHELLLIGKKGALPAPEPEDRPDSVIEAARGEHSAKPSIVAELIETMYPSLPKVELFARAARHGWDAWGNEVAA